MELDRAPGFGEIGYWVAAGARGRGVATRATRLLAEWAREALGLTRIEVLPHKDNGPSRRVAEKAGFRDSGALVRPPRGDEQEPCSPSTCGRRDDRRRPRRHAGSIRAR